MYAKVGAKQSIMWRLVIQITDIKPVKSSELRRPRVVYEACLGSPWCNPCIGANVPTSRIYSLLLLAGKSHMVAISLYPKERLESSPTELSSSQAWHLRCGWHLLEIGERFPNGNN